MLAGQGELTPATRGQCFATHVAGDALMMQPGAVDAAALLATYVAGDADDAVHTSHEMQANECERGRVNSHQQHEANACDACCRGCADDAAAADNAARSSCDLCCWGC